MLSFFRGGGTPQENGENSSEDTATSHRTSRPPVSPTAREDIGAEDQPTQDEEPAAPTQTNPTTPDQEQDATTRDEASALPVRGEGEVNEDEHTPRTQGRDTGREATPTDAATPPTQPAEEQDGEQQEGGSTNERATATQEDEDVELEDEGVGTREENDRGDPILEPATEPWSPDDGADLPTYTRTESDTLLDSVYGDHAHSNDGRHLDGGVEDDEQWQQRWIRVAQHTPNRYTVPRGKVGRRFLIILTEELRGVRDRKWNAERPLTFLATVLERGDDVSRARDIRSRLTQRMNLWETGHHVPLIDDTEGIMEGKGPSITREKDPDREARAFNAKVLSGRLRSAVRDITSRGSGGVLQPDSTCSKTGRPVLDVLKEKHPELRDPETTGGPHGPFEPAGEQGWRQPIPVNISCEVVEAVASKLSGAAGPDGVDSVDLRHWLLRFGKESEALRLEMAQWTEWIANAHPPWAAYRAMMAGRLVALDKQPGVRPVGIGSIFRRLMAKCVIKAIGRQATTVCGSLNLCAGLPAGIEGAVHAVREHSNPPPTGEEAPLPPPPPAEDDAPPRPAEPMEDASPTGTLLVDARNGFNELGRKAMLWTVRQRWPNGATFAFNCYRHSSMLILRQKGGPCTMLLSHEGVTQGDPLSMILYGIALTPLTESIRTEIPTVMQAWYADDAAMAGPVEDIARAMTLLEERGPARGYFPEPTKSIFVPTVWEARQQCQDALSTFQFQFQEGARYVGGYIGSTESQTEWITPQIEAWTEGVKTLAHVAKRYPQAAYAGLTKSLQAEWSYLQRVVPGVGHLMEPIETALEEVFIPALFGDSTPDMENIRVQLSLTVKKAGLGIPNPTLTAASQLETSRQITAPLQASLVEGTELNTAGYVAEATARRQSQRKERFKDEQADLDTLISEAPSKVEKQRLLRATKSGAWLTITPDRMNGTELAADEFRDSLRMRYGMTPIGLPSRCEGCQQKFTVEHAMSCKKGGLILLRHTDLVNEWHELCAQAITPSAVTDEPLIHTGQSRQRGDGTRHTEPEPELRGDVAVHGFWKRGTTAVFDVRVTDTETPSQRGTDFDKILARHEKEKKSKYSHPCERQRKHFTPLVFSADGIPGVECEAASKRLASRLSAKWQRTYSEVCGFVRSRLAIALAKSASRCLRWDRNPLCKKPQIPWDSGTGLSLFR